MLVFIFGNTSQSVTIVVSTFMAGLAVGSYIFGKIADRTKKLLILYGVIELLIGCLGLFSPILIQQVKVFFSHAAYLLHENRIGEVSLKGILSFLILFPPTVLMGGTLPILIRSMHSLFGNLAKQTARLYGINTFGAVFGVLLSGFIFIELFGLLGTLVLAVMSNFCLGIISLYLGRKPHYFSIKSISNKPLKESKKAVTPYSHNQARLLIIIYSISGFISLAYEILWTRLVAPAAGIYIYGFALILAVFLLGIALGSLLFEKYLLKFNPTFSLIGILQILLGLCALGVVVFVSFAMPIWTKYLYRMVVPFIVFLLPALIMGIMFPAVSRVFEGLKNVGENIGKIYALNSFGSIMGSIVAGFIMIPVFGTVQAVFVLSIINALLGIFLVLQDRYVLYKKVSLLGGILVLGLSLFGLLNAQGLLLPRLYKIHIRDALKRDPETKVVIKEDSVASLLALSSQKRRKLLYIDGISTTGLVEEVKVIGHLPVLVHPDPKDVLVVAFGMGTTFRSILSYPTINVDVVELVPTIPTFMPLFHPDAQSVLSNPRGKVIINDGRNYVFTTNKLYDVVTIDPPPPTNGAGTTVLLSNEFYKDIKKKLKARGIVHMWVHFDIDLDGIKMITKSFENNFPFIQVFLAESGKGMYILGSDQPLSLRKERVDEALKIPTVAQDMSEWTEKPYSFDRFMKMYIGTEKNVSRFTQNSDMVTDYFPRIEYSLLKSILHPQSKVTKDMILENFGSL